MSKLAGKKISAILIFWIILSGCTINAPTDPQQELLSAAGIVLTGEARIDTALDLYYRWIRGGETRAGNMIADAFAWKTNADIGFIAGGGIRSDRGIDKLDAGTITAAQLKKVMPWSSDIYSIEMTAYRLKQSLEGSVTKLGTTKSASGADDHDVDGPQHGDCYYQSTNGNGRFLHVSSRLNIVINVNNQVQEITGSTGDNSLIVSQEGKRIVKILIDNVAIYNNPTGAFHTGWVGGASSCAIGGGFYAPNNFSSSAACNKYVVAISDFQAEGNDGHPTFNPLLAEVGNDGSVTTISPDNGVDAEIVLEYLQNLARETLTVKPEVEGRITFN